jgi:signal transduction histidine kinase
MVKARKMYVPFILISATVTEDFAMNLVNEGADDFIFKDRLKRLPLSVLNAIEKYRFEKERMLQLEEARLKEVFSKELLKTNAVERELFITELTRTNDDLKQFNYITSHNFRAPLSNLTGLMNLIDLETLSEKNKVIIDLFKTTISQLNKTIKDLVEILIVRNKVNIDITNNNILELINATKELLALDISDCGCSIEIDCKVEVISFNKTYLESIIMNLLSNALKYCSSERLLKINIATSLNADGDILFSIRDNGLGIDMSKHRSNVFGLYQRFHTNENGIGLGLFMVKSQILSLGGTINIDSEVNKGTTFTITFPNHGQVIETETGKTVEHYALA